MINIISIEKSNAKLYFQEKLNIGNIIITVFTNRY